MRLARTIALAAACSALAVAAYANPPAAPPVHKAPSPPAQPASGPGGSEPVYKDILATPYSDGKTSFWIIEPAHCEKPLPVIVFNYGWGKGNPDAYGGWIGHIVRRGAIVIYPQWRAMPQHASDNPTLAAITAVHKALAELKNKGHAKADLGHFAMIGHLAGGLISANMTAVDSNRRLPEVSALMVVSPGQTRSELVAGRVELYNSLANIHPQTLMLVVVGDEDDQLAGDADARRIFTTAGAAEGNKNYVIVHSDRYGEPPLVADHMAALSIATPWSRSAPVAKPTRMHERYYNPSHTDALDYYAYWKLFDALTDAAFYGRNRDAALGNTPTQSAMGKWSDGHPVRPLTVLTSLPATYPAHSH